MWIFPHRRARNTLMWSFIWNMWGQTAQISLVMKRRIILMPTWVKNAGLAAVEVTLLVFISEDCLSAHDCFDSQYVLHLADRFVGFPKLFPYLHVSLQQFDARWRDWNGFDLCCEYSYPYVLCFQAVQEFVGHCLSSPNCSEIQFMHASQNIKDCSVKMGNYYFFLPCVRLKHDSSKLSNRAPAVSHTLYGCV